jgi:putative hydrolase of the HAD superfamily
MSDDGFDAIIFDLGGVVINIDSRRALARWAETASCDATLLQARFPHDDAGRLHETGRITDAAYFQHLRTSLAIDLSDAALLDGWNAIFVGEMPGISGVLAKAAAKRPLYAFSNTNPAHQAYFSTRFADVLGHFRQVFTSSDIGLRKPDAAAFRYVVKAIGASAERILFFDDGLANIEGARACGLKAVHVTSGSTVADTLADLDA